MTEEQKDPNKPTLRLSRNSEDSKVVDTPLETTTPPESKTAASPAPKQILKLKRENAASTEESDSAPAPVQKTEPKPEHKPEQKPPTREPEPEPETIPDKKLVQSIDQAPEPSQSPPPKPTPPQIPQASTERADDEVGNKVETSADYLEEKERSGMLSSILIVLALVALLGGSGYALYYILKSPADDAEQTESADALDIPGRSDGSLSGPINKAKDLVAEKASQLEAGSPIIEAADSADVLTDEQTAQPTPTLSGGIKESASNFLTSATIGGVRSGENPKVILNGESFSKGDVIETNTGLRFIGIKEQKLVFRDASGTVYIKSF